MDLNRSLQTAQAIKTRLLAQSKHLEKQKVLDKYDPDMTKELEEEAKSVETKLLIINKIITTSRAAYRAEQARQQHVEQLLKVDEAYKQYFPELQT